MSGIPGRTPSAPSGSSRLFFQAEDGIRDIGVTGVQTCALPIWLRGGGSRLGRGRRAVRRADALRDRAGAAAVRELRRGYALHPAREALPRRGSPRAVRDRKSVV